MSGEAPRDPRRSLLAAAIVGAGLMTAVDEIVFHQILAWHHFYDAATPALALISDGLLHSAELIALVAGGSLLLGLGRRQRLAPRSAWAGLFLGLGGFQLFDGIVDHKILRLHQIRDVEPLWPYDLAWNASALVLIAIGVILARRAPH